MTKYLTIGLLCAVALYGLIEAWPLLRGPALSLTSPAENASIPDGIVTVSGRAIRATTLTLNGAFVLHEADGTFLSTLTLPRGSSILTLIATDRFGRRATLTRTVFVP
jgi:hypothetical protein